MVAIIAIPALLAGLYALWIVGQPDALRIIQGVRRVRATVIRHDPSRDGFVAIYGFEVDGWPKEARAFVAHASPTPPLGTREVLGFPKRRPDLARPDQTFGRAILYAGFAAWLGFFGDLLLGWLS